MRFNFSYLLYLLLAAFGTLSFIEILYGSNIARDLWTNIFASLIVVVLIDRIVGKIRLQRSERSIKYIKESIFNVCHKMAYEMKPPADWEKRLENPDSEWSDYLRNVWRSNQESLNTLKTLIDMHSNLIDPELMNDIFDMITILNFGNSFIYNADSLRLPSKSNIDVLHHAAEIASAAISKAIEIIKRLELNKTTKFSTEEGQPSRLETLVIDTSLSWYKAMVLALENHLKETIELRDQFGIIARNAHTEQI